ncbi:cache domain-containing protein [Poseidonibacter lekithochrous]|uniref:sensor histidine kinase n=1 Tax=Poseidonibacter lekithochrous TaxID=1904463 RepID=UPI0008FCB156|nr:cache domain-containing protein [Poseidonibacter lekithochrous]
MLNHSEKNILKFIRFAPIVFIILLSFLITYSFILENNNNLKRDIKTLEEEYFESSKSTVTTEVQRIYDYISYHKTQSETNLKKELKERIYEAHSIASNIYAENQEKSKEEILKLIQDALRNIRFNNGRGYYFMHNPQGYNILYPLDIKLENIDYSNLQDKNGYFFVQKIKETIKNKTENFDTYYWSKPTNEGSRIFKKIAFYKYFEPLNVSIGTGEYIKDYEDSLKKEILDYISTVKYSNDGYVYIVDRKEKILAHINKDLRGKTLPQIDKNSSITKLIVQSAKKGDGFVKYNTIYHNKKTDNIEKTAFIKNFNDWQWIIGSGFYTDKLELAIKKKKEELDSYKKEYLFNVFLIIIIITTALLIASIYFSNLVQKKFMGYRNKIYKEIENNRKKDTLLAQQSKMAAMGEMIGNIAHQWRQPLSLISTSSSSLKLKQELNLITEDDITKTSDTITTTTQHLSKTIDDFRNFFKPNKENTKTTTSEVWNKTYNLIKDQYITKNINIITDIEEKAIYLLENELIQVILNLLNNARDEFDKKDLKENFIFVDIKEEAEKLYIHIKDNAGGIPAHIMGRVFEPYFTTKHQSQGTGIGLYMSQEIIKKHMEGTIEAYNSEYTYNNQKFNGAKFTITIDSY